MDSSDWANLPNDLLNSVLERLPSSSDYVRFSIVCMSWHGILAKVNGRKHTAPMLLTYSGKEETWNLCDITDDKVLDVQLELPSKRFFGFSKGWLITMDDNLRVTLINPFSRAKGRGAQENSIIRLPALNLPKRNIPSGYHVDRASISADPITNAKDCIVVVIYEDLCQLAFISLNEDTTWTYSYAEIQYIQDVVYVEDKFYAVDIYNKLHSFAITTQFKWRDVECVAEGFVQEYQMMRYLVELSDHKELLMVQRYISSKFNQYGQRYRVTTKFEVFKFVADEYKWIKINNLGDVALFVGENSSISLLASNFIGCMPNCIYFLHDWDRVPRPTQPRDFGLYSMKTQSFLSVTDTHAASLIKMSNLTPIWTVANIKL